MFRHDRNKKSYFTRSQILGKSVKNSLKKTPFLSSTSPEHFIILNNVSHNNHFVPYSIDFRRLSIRQIFYIIASSLNRYEMDFKVVKRIFTITTYYFFFYRYYYNLRCFISDSLKKNQLKKLRTLIMFIIRIKTEKKISR